MDSNQILYGDKHHRVLVVGRRNMHTTNPIWPTVVILKKSKNRHEILHDDILILRSAPIVKNSILKNRRWRTAAILKNLNRHNSAKIWRIGMKRGLMTHCDSFWPNDGNNFIFKIQDGGRPPSSKSENRHILATVRPISTKFATMTYIYPLNPSGPN